VLPVATGQVRPGQYSNFNFHQPADFGFDLFGGMLQDPFSDRNPGWCVAQGFAFNQLAGKFETIQSIFPCKVL
jgi:hypothetical protein